MAIRFGDAVESFAKARKMRQDQSSNTLDELTKMAALQEAGYTVQNQGGRFGLSRDPNFLSTKELERQKLQAEVDRMKRPMFGGGKVPSNVKVKYDEYGQPSSYETLSELEQFNLDQKRQKAADAEQSARDREELLRENAEANLQTIKTAKEGKKYFGPMGNVPSIVAPSTLFGQYGERRNWEANVNKLLSQKVLDVMTSMKQASKTGATGFGQLSNKELAVLQEASTALKKDLAPDDAMRYLEEMERIHSKFLNGGKQSRLLEADNDSEGVEESYDSPEEADANEAPGAIVLVQGRRYQV